MIWWKVNNRADELIQSVNELEITLPLAREMFKNEYPGYEQIFEERLVYHESGMDIED